MRHETMLGVAICTRRLGVVSSKIIGITACRYASASTSAAITSINLAEKGVNVNWEGDGKQISRKDFFHSIWLRHNCHCPMCYNHHSDQHTVEADKLPNVRITQAEVNGKLGA